MEEWQLMLLLWSVTVSLHAGTAVTSTSEVSFLKKEVTLEGETYIYRVFIPSDWDSGRKWPVILFLHGAGERGSDGIRQTLVGIGPAIRTNPHRFPAVVVMPQCRRGLRWDDRQIEKQVLLALEQTVDEYAGDRDRIYLTGLSMGGYGTFYFGARYPDKFAALVPICGGVVPPRELRQGSPKAFEDRYSEAAAKIGKTPLWIFHGAADDRVPVSESRKMAEVLTTQGAQVTYTEYEGVEHNSWDRAYAEPELLPWLLSQKREPGP